MNVKVMVTGAGALLGQGIIRSLRNSNLNTEIVSVDPNPYSAGLYWVDSCHLVPKADDPGYLDRITELLALEKPHAICVGTDVELAIFAEHRSMIERDFGTHVLVSDPRVVAIADDKYLTYQFMKNHGFDYPVSCLPGEEDVLLEKVGFPLIVKPRVGARSVGVGIVRNREELRRAVAVPGVVIQECVGRVEDEYTASAIVFEDEPIATIVMRRDLRDGNTYRAYVEDFPGLNESVRRFGAALQPYGPANFQFRLDAAGKPKVFEINARFSGTTPLRARAGFNEVEICLRHILFGSPIVQPKIQSMIILRHWEETVVTSSQFSRVK
jgi:carbamoyl-phosphate synthase large subunit